MTPPGLRMEPHVFAVSDAGGLRLVVARDGATWTVYDATGTIIRDGVTAARLPAVLLALVTPPKE